MKLILVFAAFTLMGQEKLVFILELNIPGQELENPKEDLGEDGTVASPSATHTKLGAKK